MKPRTKQKKLVVAISKELPRISKEQSQYFYDNCTKHIGVRLKSGKTTCLECAHQWNGDGTVNWDISKINSTCPNCKSEIAISDTRKKNFEDYAIGQVIEAFKGFQVIRSFRIMAHYKAGEKARRYMKELSRIFINGAGKFEIVGQYSQFSYYGESWVGEFSLKESYTIRKGHNMYADKVHPKISVLKELKRNGFRKSFHKMTPFDLFQSLLISSQVETLFKARQFDLVRTAYTDYEGKSDTSVIAKRWDSIKICLRNKYVVKEADIWLDYLSLLEYFGKDLKSPKYVCPTDLHKEHNRYLKKKKEREKQIKYEGQKESIRASQEQYLADKEAYFQFKIKNRDYEIEALKSVEEFLIEAEELEHCIFSNAYYEKSQSLVLSAKYKGQRTETVEFHLGKMEVVQARGYKNKPTKHHNTIIELVNSKIGEIRQIHSQKLEMSA